MKTKRKILLVLVVGLVAAALIQLIPGCGFFGKMKEEEQILSTYHFEQSAFHDLKDGEYFGECVLPLKSARVKVTVAQGAIKQIDLLEHSHGPGKSGEGVIAAVISKQSLHVDAVSGATKSSLGVIKAIENALYRKK